MSDNDWNDCIDPYRMWKYLDHHKVWSPRKLRLWCCALARKIACRPGIIPPYGRSQIHKEQETVLTICEQVADGLPTKWGTGDDALTWASNNVDLVYSWTWAATTTAISYGVYYTLNQEYGGDESLYRQEQAAELFREVFGNPINKVIYNRYCDDAVAVAKAAYEDKNFNLLPIVADAIVDAGTVEDDPVVQHLRSPGPHVKGCWALDLILWKR